MSYEEFTLAKAFNHNIYYANCFFLLLEFAMLLLIRQLIKASNHSIYYANCLY